MAKNYMTYGDAESIFTEYSAEIKKNAPYNVNTPITSQAVLTNTIKSVPKFKNGERPLIFLNDGVMAHVETDPFGTDDKTTVPAMDYAIINVGKESVGYSTTNGVLIFNVNGDDDDGYMIANVQNIGSGGGGGTNQIAVGELEQENQVVSELNAINAQLTNGVEYASVDVPVNFIFEGDMNGGNYLGFKNNSYFTINENGGLSWVINRNNHLMRYELAGNTTSQAGIQGAYPNEMFDYGFDDFYSAVSGLPSSLFIRFDYTTDMPACTLSANKSITGYRSKIAFQMGTYHVHGTYNNATRRIVLDFDGIHTIYGANLSYHVEFTKNSSGVKNWSVTQKSNNYMYITGFAGIYEFVEYYLNDFDILNADYIPPVTHAVGSMILYDEIDDMGVTWINEMRQPIPSGKYLVDMKVQDYMGSLSSPDMLHFTFTSVDHGVTYEGTCARNIGGWNTMTLSISHMEQDGFKNVATSWPTITARQSTSYFVDKGLGLTEIFFRVANKQIELQMMMQNDNGYTLKSAINANNEIILEYIYKESEQQKTTINYLTNFLNDRKTSHEYMGMAKNGNTCWPLCVTVATGSAFLDGENSLQILIYNPTNTNIPTGSVVYLPNNILLDYTMP